MKLKHRLIISFVGIVIMPFVLYGISSMSDGMESLVDRGLPANASPELVEQRVTDFFISGIILMTLMSVLLIFWIYHGVLRKVEVLVTGAHEIEEGNLDFSIDIKGNDELASVGVAFEEMRQRLREDARRRMVEERNQRQLISNIAHDLKTPLTAIRGYSEGLMDGVAVTPEKQRSYVTTIYNKAQEMDVLLNELTAYAKLETNRIPYHFIRMNIRNYFDDLTGELRMDLASRGASLVYYDYVEDDGFFVVDPIQMGRVFHNIIDNSMKYARKDEPLVVHFGVWPEEGLVHIEIKDNGVGIAPKDLPHIFERLYRGDPSRTAAGGSGIGLSIVKKITEDHGGTVSVISSEGKGTTVSFVLKKIRQQEEEKEKEKREKDTDRRRRRGNRRA